MAPRSSVCVGDVQRLLRETGLGLAAFKRLRSPSLPENALILMSRPDFLSMRTSMPTSRLVKWHRPAPSSVADTMKRRPRTALNHCMAASTSAAPGSPFLFNRPARVPLSPQSQSWSRPSSPKKALAQVLVLFRKGCGPRAQKGLAAQTVSDRGQPCRRRVATLRQCGKEFGFTHLGRRHHAASALRVGSVHQVRPQSWLLRCEARGISSSSAERTGQIWKSLPANLSMPA